MNKLGSKDYNFGDCCGAIISARKKIKGAAGVPDYGAIKNLFFTKNFIELTTSTTNGINFEVCTTSSLCKKITRTTDGTNNLLFLCIQGKVRLAQKAKLTLHCVIHYRKVFLYQFWQRCSGNC